MRFILMDNHLGTKIVKVRDSIYELELGHFL